MNVFKSALKYLGLLVVAIVVVAFFLPAKATASRQINIKASPELVFALLNGFQRFNEFSPWFQYDPKAKYSWSGPTTGVGAKMSWTSEHPRVGNGSQEIIALEANKSVTTRLQFDAPADTIARWTLDAADGGTRVNWTLEGDAGLNPIGRWFGVFIDRMIGPDFESGLARLKAVAEAEAAKPVVPAATLEVLSDVAPLDIAYVSLRSEMDVAKIGNLLGSNYALIGDFLKTQGLAMAGPVGAINHSVTEKEWVFDAIVPFAGPVEARAKAAAAKGPIRIGTTPAGRTIKAVHVGPYEGMQQTYEKIAAYQRDKKLESRGLSWEQYVSDPANTPPERLVSYVFQPIK
jgi:effector-binding domain-containing protein